MSVLALYTSAPFCSYDEKLSLLYSRVYQCIQLCESSESTKTSHRASSAEHCSSVHNSRHFPVSNKLRQQAASACGYRNLAGGFYIRAFSRDRRTFSVQVAQLTLETAQLILYCIEIHVCERQHIKRTNCISGLVTY